MKRLLATILSVWCLSSQAAPNSFTPTFVFSPYMYAGDYTPILNRLTTVLTSAAWPDITTTQTAVSAMPANLKSLTWAFAIGNCSTETWNGVAGSTFATANVASFVAAGKTYTISAGGANNTFLCSSNANMLTYLNRYNSARLIGADFDIEGATSGGNATVTLSGTTLTCTANCGNISQYSTLTGAGCATAPATMVATYANPNGTLNQSGCTSGTYFMSVGTAYTYPQILSLVQTLQNAQVNGYPNLKFSFTVSAYGSLTATYNSLGTYGMYVMNAVAATGLNNATYNLMTMDMSNDSAHCTQLANLSGCDMGLSTINAATAVHTWFGIPYENLEVTPMIGTNNVVADIFNNYDICPVCISVKNRKMAGIHFWSFSRDRDCPSTQSVNDVCNSIGNKTPMTPGTLGYTKAISQAIGD